jgi:hypothetical protein
MGAEQFTAKAIGETSKLAFASAVKQAQYDFGHAGYTGSIAEKQTFVLIGSAPDAKSAESMAEDLLDANDERVTDKWGPAGCIKIENEPKTYLFFGWASS